MTDEPAYAIADADVITRFPFQRGRRATIQPLNCSFQTERNLTSAHQLQDWSLAYGIIGDTLQDWSLAYGIVGVTLQDWSLAYGIVGVTGGFGYEI
jgi:hypothetical protein